MSFFSKIIDFFKPASADFMAKPSELRKMEAEARADNVVATAPKSGKRLTSGAKKVADKTPVKAPSKARTTTKKK